MKKLLLFCLLALSLSVQAQQNRNFDRGKDNTGLAITASGVVLGTIAVFVKDGGEYTYANGYNSQRINKPFYQCTNRVVMLGVSVTVSIGGLFYQRNNR